jgi:hypothetical protein
MILNMNDERTQYIAFQIISISISIIIYFSGIFLEIFVIILILIIVVSISKKIILLCVELIQIDLKNLLEKLWKEWEELRLERKQGKNSEYYEFDLFTFAETIFKFKIISF